VQIAEFELERYFARWEFAVRHVLCASDAEPIALANLLSLADDDSRQRWETLHLGYTESLGLPALRAEIANLYPGLAPDDIITFAGAEEGVFLCMQALVGPGDHAVVAWPAYQSLHEVARAAGGEITLVPLDPRNWSLDVDAVAAAMRPNTKVIVVNSPHSPTGAQLSPEQLNRLISIAELHGAFLFSDEVYRFLEHSAAELSPAAACSPRAISLGVMSKAFGLAGLRIGWLALRDATLRARIARLKDYTTICNSAPSEILALMALRAKDALLTRTRKIMSENLSLLDGFFARNAERFSWVRPRASSVGFPKWLGGSVDEFAARLVEREGVLILPASRFGYPGNYFRLGFGRRDMPEALAKMESFASQSFASPG